MAKSKNTISPYLVNTLQNKLGRPDRVGVSLSSDGTQGFITAGRFETLIRPTTFRKLVKAGFLKPWSKNQKPPIDRVTTYRVNWPS